MVSRGASIVARPSRLGSNWTASCTKPVGFKDDDLPSAYSIGEVSKQAQKQAMLKAVKILDAGNNLIISGKTKQAVQAALDEFQTQGVRILSGIAQTGDVWMASCENPQVGASQCRVENFGPHVMIYGPTRVAVEGKVIELAERGTKLISEIEQDSEGNWVAVCDTSDPSIGSATIR